MDERPNSSGLLVVMLAVIALGLLLAVGIAGGGYIYMRRQREHERDLAIESLHRAIELERIRAQELADENARDE